MILVLRAIGWLMILCGFGVLGVELMSWAQAGFFKLHTFGQIWFNLDPGGLNLAQAITERYISVWLWDAVITPFLHWSALPTLMIPGLLMAESHRLAAFFRRFVSANHA
ncbi:MAG: hypothetical protein AAF495_25450 [Pseudomonadota bacterium]